MIKTIGDVCEKCGSPGDEITGYLHRLKGIGFTMFLCRDCARKIRAIIRYWRDTEDVVYESADEGWSMDKIKDESEL